MQGKTKHAVGKYGGHGASEGCIEVHYLLGSNWRTYRNFHMLRKNFRLPLVRRQVPRYDTGFRLPAVPCVIGYKSAGVAQLRVKKEDALHYSWSKRHLRHRQSCRYCRGSAFDIQRRSAATSGLPGDVTMHARDCLPFLSSCLRLSCVLV